MRTYPFVPLPYEGTASMLLSGERPAFPYIGPLTLDVHTLMAYVVMSIIHILVEPWPVMKALVPSEVRVRPTGRVLKVATVVIEPVLSS